MREPTRCWWAGDDPLYVAYHDEEWGVPVHDERKLFEMLILEGAQAGLSWITARFSGCSSRNFRTRSITGPLCSGSSRSGGR